MGKKLVQKNFRISKAQERGLKSLAKRTGKTETQILEWALVKAHQQLPALVRREMLRKAFKLKKKGVNGAA